MFLALAGAAAVGCAHKKTPTSSSAPVIATLERTACFGTCPAYEVKVHADGFVVYEGKDFVKLKGRHTAQVPPGKIAALAAAFESAGYWELHDYDDQQVVDNAWANTSFTHKGKSKTVRHYLSDHSAPQSLADLEGKIDDILDTSRWVGTPEERDKLERDWMK